jgi:hypothetical protein
MELVQREGVMDPGRDNNPENPTISFGFKFLGQFIDHDIFLD